MTGGEDRPHEGLAAETPESVEEESPSGVDALGSRAIAAGVLAWVIPGAGHFLLGKRARAVAFAAIILVCAAIGCQLQGRLDVFVANDPLSKIATLASAGSGVIYMALRFLFEYEGSIVAPGFEYGTTFLRTAGILNLLLVLDALDIARGRKS